jgi:hypothetical protein
MAKKTIEICDVCEVEKVSDGKGGCNMHMVNITVSGSSVYAGWERKHYEVCNDCVSKIRIALQPFFKDLK